MPRDIKKKYCPASLAFFVFLFMTGCNKPGSFIMLREYIEGRVLEDGTDIPVRSATLFVTKCKSPAGGTVCTDVGETSIINTDEFGYFIIDKKTSLAAISATHRDYWTFDRSYNGNTAGNTDLNFKLIPPVLIKVRLINVNNAYSSQAGIEFIVESPAATSPASLFLLGAVPADTTVYFKGFGNHSNIIKWNIIDGGTNTANEFLPVIASPSDTIKLELEY